MAQNVVWASKYTYEGKCHKHDSKGVCKQNIQKCFKMNSHLTWKYQNKHSNT